VSYILDALKKSEAERSRGAVPTLLTPPQTSFRSSIIGWGVVVALIVNAGLFGAWLYWPRNGSSPVVSAPAAAQVATPTVASSVAPASTNPTGPDAASPPLEYPVLPSSSNAAPPPANTRAPDVDVANDTGGTADVSFSTHVYATDPSMRAVTMNGKRFVEGDTIRPGIRIREITETGVILDVNGRPVPVDVLQDWR
jgi:general secretion pathway protein B